MEFDSADLDQLEANNELVAVILHEMVHVFDFAMKGLLNCCGRVTVLVLAFHGRSTACALLRALRVLILWQICRRLWSIHWRKCFAGLC